MKYEEYKDSGVAWIGEIPSHWEMVKLKYNFTIYAGATPKTEISDLWNGDIIWITPADYKTTDKYIMCGERTITKKGYDSCNTQIVPRDSLIFSKRAPIGTVAISGIELCTNQGCLSCVPKGVSTTFFYYATSVYSEIFDLLGSGATFKEISASDFSNVKLATPPLDEQQAIVNYLDEKCGKINNAIDVQKKKIDLLNELKQTIITNAVTKGLNPNAPMKDSGVEWIGEIPEHWKIKRTRFLCNIQTGDKDTVNREDDGLYPFYVRSPKVERINTYSFDGEAVLMAGDGVGAGKVFHYANGKFDYHQRVYNLHNFKDVSGLFFYYYILNKFRYIIEEGAAKNTVDSVRLNMIQDFWMTIPPVSEQQNIVKYIDGEISKIDSQIAKANQRIELLNELKQSIITEAITGKIKVC